MTDFGGLHRILHSVLTRIPTHPLREFYVICNQSNGNRFTESLNELLSASEPLIGGEEADRIVAVSAQTLSESALVEFLQSR